MWWPSLSGVKRPGRGVNHPPPFSAEVKESVKLYFYSPCVSSCEVIGWAWPSPSGACSYVCDLKRNWLKYTVKRRVDMSVHFSGRRLWFSKYLSHFVRLYCSRSFSIVIKFAGVCYERFVGMRYKFNLVTYVRRPLVVGRASLPILWNHGF